MSYLTIRSIEEAHAYQAMMYEAAQKTCRWIGEQNGDPMDILKRMKFECVGLHPIEHKPLNFIEQINQTWSYAVAVSAAKQLLKLHPEANGFYLAPGAHASLELDIMSIEPGLVGAEIFAAVKPSNNNKLQKDLQKLAKRIEIHHRYVFFHSPKFSYAERQVMLEKYGVQVWSVDL